MDRVITEHELYSDEADDKNEDLTWIESFIADMTTEAREIYEGAKNFARNTIYGEDGHSLVTDPKLIHENFD